MGKRRTFALAFTGKRPVVSGEVVAEFFESNEPRSLKGKEAQE